MAANTKSQKTKLRIPLSGRVSTNGLNGATGVADIPLIDIAGNFIGTGISTTGSAAPAAGVFSAIQVAKAIYNFATDGGAPGLITPALNTTIPANAIILGGFGKASSVTALAQASGGTIALGTSAGSSATALLGATAGAEANWANAAIIPLVPTLAVPIELTAAGKITLTPATHAITAGIIEIYVFFVIPTYA
jgi:hypothetical protein